MVKVLTYMDIFSVTMKAELHSTSLYDLNFVKQISPLIRTSHAKQTPSLPSLPNYLLVIILVRKRKPHQSEDIILQHLPDYIVKI